ncbi:MAG: BatA domain-containing protein [Planctomycetota bacterium]
MNWAYPDARWFLLFIPAVILLYFLRLKRREVQVSSTLLWSKVLEDRRVNSPFQRFRRSLLLLLQILAIALLTAALAQPERESERVEGRVHLLLVDASASMDATEGGETRLARARRLARERVRGMGKGERAVVIRFDRGARAVTPVSADRDLLSGAIGSIETRPTITSIDAAMELALSIARNEDDAVAVIYSDGAFPAWTGGEIPLPVEYVRVGEAAPSSGVTALASRFDLSGAGRLQVFVEVRNAGSAPVRGTLSMFAGGAIVRAAETEGIEPGGRWSHSFEAGEEAPEASAILEVRWEPQGEDALESDNRAWLAIEPRGEITLWRVGLPNFLLDDALGALPRVRVSMLAAEEVAGRAQAGEPLPDVILWDRIAPERMIPGPGHLLFGALPPGVWEDPQRVEFPPIVAWDRRHPVNRFLTYGTLEGEIARGWILPARPGTVPLLDSRGGALISIFQGPEARGIAVGFDLLDSKWPLKPSFPFFLFNAVRFLGLSEGGAATGIRAGELLSVDGGEAVERYEIERPGGDRVDVEAAADGWLRYSGTDRLGAYRIRWEEPVAGGREERARAVPVNLLSLAETDVSPREKLEIAGREISQEAASTLVRAEYWPWLLALAILLLLVEWFEYHRR